MEFPSSANRYAPNRPIPPLSSLNHHRHIHRRDFHHRQPPPFTLPPPPPPLYPPLPPAPPPPPPFSPHQSNFTFLNRHHTPPRVSLSRSPLPLSEFDNPYPPSRSESWSDPPRVSSYRPTTTFHSDYEFDSTRSSFRDEFIDPYRENRDTIQYQNQRLFGDRKDHSIGNYDSYGHRFCSESPSLNLVRENYDSRYGSVLENESFLYDSRDENRRLMQMEHNSKDFVSAGREHKIYDSGRSSNRDREDREGSFHTPKKKSVLLRIGKPNEVRNSRSYEQNVSSVRSKGKQKDHSVYLNHRIDEEREHSPVDLDVSFKSNALVAKAIVTDQSSPGKSFTHRSRKSRKLSVTGSPPIKLVEQSFKLGNSAHASDCPSSSEKPPLKVSNVTVSGTLSVERTESEVGKVMVSSSVSGAKKLSDSRSLKRSPGDTVSDENHKISGLCESPSYRIRKKKKVVSLSSHSNVKLTKKVTKAVGLDSPTNTPVSPNQGVMHLEESNSFVDIKHDLVSLPSPDVLNVNRLDGSPQAIASGMDDYKSDSGRSPLLDSMRSCSTHLSGSPGPLETEFDKGSGIPCGSVSFSASVLDNVQTESGNGCTVSGIARGDGVIEEACKNEKDVSLDNGSTETSSKDIVPGGNDNASLSGPDENNVHEGCQDPYLDNHDYCNVSCTDIGFKSFTFSNIDLMDTDLNHSSLHEAKSLQDTGTGEAAHLHAADTSAEGNTYLKHSPLNEVKSLQHTGIGEAAHLHAADTHTGIREAAHLHAADTSTEGNTDLKHSPLHEAKSLRQTGIGEAAHLHATDTSAEGNNNIDLSKADATNLDQRTMNEFSSFGGPSSPSSSNIGLTNIQGDGHIVCPLDDLGNRVSLSETSMIQENALVEYCSEGGVPKIDDVEVCSGMDSLPNGKRKRCSEGIQSDFTGSRIGDKDVNVVSLVRDEIMLTCSVKECSEENDDCNGAGNIHATCEADKGDSIMHRATRKESSIEVGVVKDGNNVALDGASPKYAKKIKVSHINEKVAPDFGSALTLEKSPKDFIGEMKIDQELVTDLSTDPKYVSLPSQDTHNTLQAVKPSKGDSNLTRKKPTSAVPRVFTGPSSLHLSNSKRSTTTNHNAKSRSWHRSGTSNASVPVSKTLALPVSAPRISPEKAGKVQGSSYIRKGNSLVRKTGTMSAIPHASRPASSSVYRLNPSSKDELSKSSGSENKLCMNGSDKWLRTRDGDETSKSLKSESRGGITTSASPLRTGYLVASYEGPKTPPLSQINNSLCSTTSHGGDLLTNTRADIGSETTSMPVQQTSDVDIPITSGIGHKFSECLEYPTSFGLNNEFKSQRVIDEGKSGKITYVRRKSNQLIATTNSNIMSDHDVDKTQIFSSDSYYKRKSNQLIRSTMENHIISDVPENSISSEVKMISTVPARRSSSKRHLNKVWRLSNTHSSKKDGNGNSLHQKPPLFPWKRAACFQSSMHNSAYSFANNSVSSISRKLLLSRKRDTVYTRSRRGFSLRISKLLSVGGSSLKWSKSIERNSKRVSEEATLAVAAAQKKKQEQNNSPCIVSGTKSSLRDRVFRIGSIRYKMDPTRRTLQRISDAEPSRLSSSQSEDNVTKSYVPRRLKIGNDEYVRIGNGNQLIRDPKKLARTLASERVRWSLHTARLRLSRKSKYCQFFTRFGKCNKDDGKCPYVHDRSKIVVCTKFLNGSCTSVNCKLTHKVIPERMQDCSYYQQGVCCNSTCPYRHVNVNANASICEGFLKGYCDDGNECRKKHTYVCPKYEATGICPQGSKCKLHHPKRRSTGIKRKSLRVQKNVRGRYFGTRTGDTVGSRTMKSEMLHIKSNDDIFDLEGKFADYISLDISDEEAGDAVGFPIEQVTMSPPDEKACDLDELIKPMGLIYRNPAVDPSLVNGSLDERSTSYMSEESLV